MSKYRLEKGIIFVKQEYTIHATWIAVSLENITDLILVLFSSKSRVSVLRSKWQSCTACDKRLEALSPGEVLGKWIQAALPC